MYQIVLSLLRNYIKSVLALTIITFCKLLNTFIWDDKNIFITEQKILTFHFFFNDIDEISCKYHIINILKLFI